MIGIGQRGMIYCGLRGKNGKGIVLVAAVSIVKFMTKIVE